MPAHRTYGYLRVSFLDDDRNRRAMSIDTQQERVRCYFDYQRQIGGTLLETNWARRGWRGVRENGEDTTDGFFVDQDVSAYKKPFLTRPAGRRLSAALEMGDQVIFARLDRAFRSVRDAMATIDIWTRRQIGVHFLDPQVDLTTAHGRAFLQMSAVWAEFSSALHSERMSEVNGQARKVGKGLNGKRPFGWYTPNGSVTPQPHYEERAILSWILHLRDAKGKSWRQIETAVEAALAKKEGREPQGHVWGDLRFGFARCRRAYLAAQKLGLEPTEAIEWPELAK
jgi:DNA invertase Pin-like site-specific DNA recombinase